jgi:hypothetical protein
VVNDGWVSITVLGIGRDMPGMRLIGVEGQFPSTLAPGQSASFAVNYRITDCEAVSADEWPVPVRVRRWWGEQTDYVDLPPQAMDVPDTVYYLGDGGHEAQWQYNLASIACAHPGS